MLPWNQELVKLTGCASLELKLLFFHQYLLYNFEAKCNCESKLETTQRWTLLTSYGICQTQTLSLICQQKTQKSNLWKFRCRSSFSIKRANISVISNHEKIKDNVAILKRKNSPTMSLKIQLLALIVIFELPNSHLLHYTYLYICLFFFTHSQFPFFRGLCRKSHKKNWHQ